MEKQFQECTNLELHLIYIANIIMKIRINIIRLGLFFALENTGQGNLVISR